MENEVMLITRAIKNYSFNPDVERHLIGYVNNGSKAITNLNGIYMYGLQQDKRGNTIHYNSNEFMKINPPSIIKPDIVVVDKNSKPKKLVTGVDLRWFVASELGWIEFNQRTKRWKIRNQGKDYVAKLYSDGRNLEFTPLGNKELTDILVDTNKIVTRSNADFRKYHSMF